MAESVSWYLALLLVGAAGWLPAALLFDRLESRGVFVARPLAMALLGLVTYLVVRLTPVAYGTPVVVGALAFTFALGVVIAVRRRDLVEALVGRWRRLLVAEALFLGIFVLVAFVRSFTPDASYTEKPADLMFLTAVHRAEEFPPPDPWLSGERISYYFLGQVQMDGIGRLSGNPPEVTFNLATATAAAAGGVAIVGLALDVLGLAGTRRRGRIVGGIVALGGLLLASPFVGLIQVLAANGIGGEVPWGWLGVEGVPTTEGAYGVVPREFWWWWETTRIVPGVIAEFPAFTVLLGDPHAHLFALPLGLAALGLAVQVLHGGQPLTWRRWFREPVRLLLTSAFFASMLMSNSWDVVSFGAIWGLAAWWAIARTGWPPILAGFVALRWALVPAVLAGVFAWPFLVTLDPNPLGLTPTVGLASDPGRWALVWLPALLPTLAALVLLRHQGALPRPRGLPSALGAAVIPVVLWVAWLIGRGEAGELAARSWGWGTLAILVVGIAWAGATCAAVEGRDRALGAGLWLLAVGCGLLLLTELAHVDDAFDGRLNTAFKFWFHAWAILAVAGTVLAARAADGIALPSRASGGDRNWRGAAVVWVGTGVCLAVWAATMTTPVVIAVTRAGEGQERGLNAIAYLDRVDPGVAGAVRWVRENLDPEEHVLVQAVGEAYSAGNRLASATGVPTLLAWPGHERQWRGDIQEQARRDALWRIYTGRLDDAREAALQWGVTHVFVGFEERTAYGSEVARRFRSWPQTYLGEYGAIYEVPR